MYHVLSQIAYRLKQKKMKKSDPFFIRGMKHLLQKLVIASYTTTRFFYLDLSDFHISTYRELWLSNKWKEI